MERFLEKRDYRKKQKPLLFLGLSVLSWALILLWYFYKPVLGYETDRDFIELDYITTPIYSFEDRGEGFKVYKTDRSYSPGTKVKPVGGYLYDKKQILVDDEDGNRFIIPAYTIEDHIYRLKILNKEFRYVFRGNSLNGKNINEIIDKAGEYTIHDKDKRFMVFPQIVLFDGAYRTKGVCLFYDENGTVTETGGWNEPYNNLFAYVPWYDRIASMNLFCKFQRFQVSNNYDKDGYGNILPAVLWYIFDCITSTFFLMFIFLVLFFAFYAVLWLFSNLRFVPNLVIYILGYLIWPVLLVVGLASLMYYINLWILVAFMGLSMLGWSAYLIRKFVPAAVRCDKCRRMNCIDVTESDFYYGKNVLASYSLTFTEGEHTKQDFAQEKWKIRTHFYEKCSCCGNIVEYDKNSEKLQERKPLAEIDCPQCGQFALEAESVLLKNEISTSNFSSTKKGKIKKTDDWSDGPDYIRVDKVEHSSITSGYLTYDRICKCKNCDYKYSETFKYYYNSGLRKGGTSEKTTGWWKI